MKISQQKIMVTGASGFIGRLLCERLVALGADVHALSRGATPGLKNGICWWQCDVGQTDAVHRTVAAVRPDLIFHLAGVTQGARAPELVWPTFQCNLLSAVNALSAAYEHGCRKVILAGSLEEPDSGSSEVVPSSPCAASKWAASAYGRMFHSLFQLDVVILRVFMVFGPAQNDVRKLIPHVILELLQGRSVKLTRGDRPVDWIYVDDVVEGFLAAARAEYIGGRTIDIGSGELVTVRGMVEQLAPMVRRDAKVAFWRHSRTTTGAGAGGRRGRRKEALGWAPVVPLREGLLRTVAWYRQHSQVAGDHMTLVSNR